MPTKKQQAELTELQAQLAAMTRQQVILTKQIQQERDRGLPSEAELKACIDSNEHEFARLTTQISKAKTTAKRRKTEIAQWKSNFEALDKLDKSQELQQMQAEIDWRASHIAESESKIAELYEQKTQLMGELEQQKIQLQIMEQGCHKKSIHEDPRLTALQEEVEQLQTRIAMYSTTA